ncbi:MAG: 6-phosphogluconolactonase [Gemmatimonadota bacterium]
MLIAAADSPGVVRLALSGGHGPKPVLERLAVHSGIPWSRIEIFFADERAVPPDNEESNFHLVMSSLVSRLSLPPHAVHRMAADHSDIERAAREYEDLLPDKFDILVLGIGDDGHTASLFPGHAEVALTTRRVAPATSPRPPYTRMTITPPMITGARIRVMLASGENKAPAVARACEGPLAIESCPAQLARDGTWILDGPAASRLRVVRR